MKKNDYAPIDFDEIEDHDERYDDIKRENQRKRKIGKNMRIKAEEERKK